LSEGAVLQTIQEQVATLKNPPRTVEEVLDTLRRVGITQSTARLRELLPPA
jgi:hypothetical protein